MPANPADVNEPIQGERDIGKWLDGSQTRTLYNEWHPLKKRQIKTNIRLVQSYQSKLALLEATKKQQSIDRSNSRNRQRTHYHVTIIN